MEPQAEHRTSQYGKLSISVQYTNDCSDSLSVVNSLKNLWPDN